jgi:hypothetical protein
MKMQVYGQVQVQVRGKVQVQVLVLVLVQVQVLVLVLLFRHQDVAQESIELGIEKYWILSQ